MTDTTNESKPTQRPAARRRVAQVVGALLLVAVGIQFIPYGVDNPSARDEPKWDSARTRQLFMTACADCHSNQTKILWFEHAAPIKWYVTSHVKDGRHALNIDTWHTSAGEGADEAANVIRKGSMPPDFYTYLGLHGDAKLTPSERQQLHDGLAKILADDPPKQ